MRVCEPVVVTMCVTCVWSCHSPDVPHTAGHPTMSALEELLQADPVDLDAIRRFCQDEGIPAELRLRLWRQFLGIDADDSPLGATPDAELDPQIKVDVELLNTRMGTLLSPDVCELLQVP